MRFANIAVALTFAASVLAWRIPEGTEDGVYKVETLEDGSTVHTKVIDAADIDRTSPEYAALNDLVPTETSLDTSLEKRGTNGGVWCGCGFDLIHGDCDAAVADLKSQMVSNLKFRYIGFTLTAMYRSIRSSRLATPTTPFVAG
jgi:hypothetical protein